MIELGDNLGYVDCKADGCAEPCQESTIVRSMPIGHQLCEAVRMPGIDHGERSIGVGFCRNPSG